MRTTIHSLCALAVSIGALGGCSSPASIDVEPATPRLTNELKSIQLEATVKDDKGAVLKDVPVAFRSLTPTLLTVDDTGKVSALGSGSATVLVTAGKIKKEVTVVIQLAKKVVIEPSSPRLMLGVSRGFKASVRNDKDEPMVVLGKVRWTSSDPSIMTVDRRGNVKTLKEGTVKLTAHAAGISGTTEVEVRHEKLHEDGTLD